MRPGISQGTRGSAFTLIELMVVCVLVAILTALIIPEMRGSYEDALLRSTSRKLMDAFDLAYSEAVSHNQLNRVRVDSEVGKYFIETRVRDAGEERFVPSSAPGASGDLDRRISIQIESPAEEISDETNASETSSLSSAAESEIGPAQAISFYPDGTADGREVQLQDRQGFRLALRINPITARVRVIQLGRK